MFPFQAKIAVPGKLMIAGEYAVLSQDQMAVVAAVDRYVTIKVFDSKEHLLHVPDLGLMNVKWKWMKKKLHLSKADSRLNFIKNAICAVHQYLGGDCLSEPFGLSIESELDHPSGKKFGLGSSAAIVTGVVAALLYAAEDLRSLPEKKTIYKVAAVAHFLTQGSGSGADIAASTYGGWIGYSSFDPEWMRDQLNKDDPLKNLIDKPWPHFTLTHLELPGELSFCVGWTGKPASTASMIKKVKQLKNIEPAAFQRFLENCEHAVEEVLNGFHTGDPNRLLNGLSLNRKALIELGQALGAPIETKELKKLADLAEENGGAGKSSGAGAGDCGIAMIHKDSADRLHRSWRNAGIEPLTLHPAASGVTITI